MEIFLPDSVDLASSRQYALLLDVYAAGYSFSLHKPDEEGHESYRYRFPSGDRTKVFNQFREAFFSHPVFSYPFREIRIVNRTPVFTSVPNFLYEEKDAAAYLQLTFMHFEGQILCQQLEDPAMTLLHVMPAKEYGFLVRSFPGAVIAHHSAGLIAWSQEQSFGEAANRMFLFRGSEGIDLLYFSHQQLMMNNYFHCQSLEDALYYALYVSKQLKFDSRKDCVFLVDAEDELQARLRKYIQNVVTCEDNQWDIQESSI
jgi:hypothetical protein